MNKAEKLQLEKEYLGKRVRVIIDDPYRPVDAEGVVKYIDDMGQLHGGWGGLAAIPGEDIIQILD